MEPFTVLSFICFKFYLLVSGSFSDARFLYMALKIENSLKNCKNQNVCFEIGISGIISYKLWEMWKFALVVEKIVWISVSIPNYLIYKKLSFEVRTSYSKKKCREYAESKLKNRKFSQKEFGFWENKYQFQFW